MHVVPNNVNYFLQYSPSHAIRICMHSTNQIKLKVHSIHKQRGKTNASEKIRIQNLVEFEL